jgi:hypothetical protein
MGFEPMNTGFADQRVSHFATGASRCQSKAGLNFMASRPFTSSPTKERTRRMMRFYFGCAAVRRYGFTVLKPGKSCAASSFVTTPAMTMSSPTFQFAGVDTLCFVVS